MTKAEHKAMIVMFGLQHRILKRLVKTLREKDFLTDEDVKQMDYAMVHPESFDDSASDQTVTTVYENTMRRLLVNIQGEDH